MWILPPFAYCALGRVNPPEHAQGIAHWRQSINRVFFPVLSCIVLALSDNTLLNRKYAAIVLVLFLLTVIPNVLEEVGVFQFIILLREHAKV